MSSKKFVSRSVILRASEACTASAVEHWSSYICSIVTSKTAIMNFLNRDPASDCRRAINSSICGDKKNKRTGSISTLYIRNARCKTELLNSHELCMFKYTWKLPVSPLWQPRFVPCVSLENKSESCTISTFKRGVRTAIMTQIKWPTILP